MHIKKYIAGELKLLQIQQKSMGLLFYIPIFINWLVLPVLSYFIFARWEQSIITYSEILRYIQYFTPFAVSIWILFSLSEYVEGRGNELYFVSRRMRALNVLLWLMVYIAIATAPFVIYQQWAEGISAEIFRIAAECVFFAGLTYLLVFVTSAPATMAIVLIYTVFAALGANNTDSFLIYYDGRRICDAGAADKYRLLMAAAVVLFICAAIANKRFKKYK